MRIDAARRLAALALLACATPLGAATVYVPVLSADGKEGTQRSTEVWLTTYATAQKAVKATLVAADLDGTKPPVPGNSFTVPPAKTFLYTGLSKVGQVNLLHVDAPEGLAVQARLTSTPSGGPPAYAEVPVISERTRLPAKATAHLIGLERDPVVGHSSHLGVVNLGTAIGSCELTFFRSDGTQIGPAREITLKPLSLRHFDDALATVGESRIWAVRVAVSCDQPFYPYAVFAGADDVSFFITPSSGVVSPATPGPTPTPTPTPGSSYVFERPGVVHTSTSTKPKGVLAVDVPKALNLKRLIIDLDFVRGPWSTEKQPGNHGIIWLHRGSFRSNTIANFNTFGPNKYTVKFNQNIDLGAGQVTAAEGGLNLAQGKTYHLRYVYDAEKAIVTAQVSADGVVLRTITAAATTRARVLTIPAKGLVAEFGHFYGQEGPEVASPPGWKYSNLRVEMVPY